MGRVVERDQLLHPGDADRVRAVVLLLGGVPGVAVRRPVGRAVDHDPALPRLARPGDDPEAEVQLPGQVAPLDLARLAGAPRLEDGDQDVARPPRAGPARRCRPAPVDPAGRDRPDRPVHPPGRRAVAVAAVDAVFGGVEQGHGVPELAKARVRPPRSCPLKAPRRRCVGRTVTGPTAAAGSCAPPGTVSSVGQDRHTPQVRSPSRAIQVRSSSQVSRTDASSTARSGRSRKAVETTSTAPRSSSRSRCGTRGAWAAN